MNMFCYQCEQTAKGTGCTSHGVCGKDPEVASLQDLLVYGLKDISRYADRARQLGATDRQINVFTVEALFSTLTNTNFDIERFKQYMKKAAELKEKAVEMYEKAAKEKGIAVENLSEPGVKWNTGLDDVNEMERKGEAVTIQNRIDSLGEDITGLQETITYGLKGLSAYADHAQKLGQESEEVYGFVHKALNYLTQKPEDTGELLGYVLETGKANLAAMGLLDKANTGSYGHPEPTSFRITPVKGKAVLISGHDLKDMERLLEQTEGKGINVYTHGEMLPANAYPAFKKYEHFRGNYGGAWQDQRQEFEQFPGAILMTTNCIMKPKDSYKHRIFTSGPAGWENITHITDGDFTPVIEAAQNEEGFTEDGEEKYIMAGFGHNAVMNVADKVVGAVKEGKIKHFFLIGGCDGAKPGRNYYTEFAEKVPQDCVIMTLACGKYRFNKLPFGDIGGIPRLLDVGQCNDSYSAIRIAQALAKAFGVGINELPLSMVLSWYEQKAVAILLTLLYLDVKNIKLGPTLPAFISPNVLNVLVDKFNISPISNVEEDMAEMLGEQVSS